MTVPKFAGGISDRALSDLVRPSAEPLREFVIPPSPNYAAKTAGGIERIASFQAASIEMATAQRDELTALNAKVEGSRPGPTPPTTGSPTSCGPPPLNDRVNRLTSINDPIVVVHLSPSYVVAYVQLRHRRQTTVARVLTHLDPRTRKTLGFYRSQRANEEIWVGPHWPITTPAASNESKPVWLFA